MRTKISRNTYDNIVYIYNVCGQRTNMISETSVISGTKTGLWSIEKCLPELMAGVDDLYMNESDIYEKLYLHPELLSLLTENLSFCSDTSEALAAVAAGNDAALLKTISCTGQEQAFGDTLKR